MHPDGMPETFDPLRAAFHRLWHPYRMRFSFNTIPVVSAMLRPPATLCHPFGMNRNDPDTPGDSFLPRFPMTHQLCDNLVGLDDSTPPYNLCSTAG